MTCPACESLVPDGSRFCPACGSGLSLSTMPTATNTPSPPRQTPGEQSPPKKRSPRATHLSSSNSLYEPRFVPGTTLADRYRIVSPLGKGGMGEVYRAEDLKLGQTVALKFLPRSLLQAQDALERFRREVRLARQVSHPNVCRVFDLGEVNGETFLTMEYVDGEDLASLIRRIGRLPPDKALDIGKQMCAGLGAAHELGIIHRDLKPANIMLDGRGRVRITDFGLASLLLEGNGPDAGAGTPAYMSPEQLRGSELTPQSDLYSLGLVLYETLTGKRPVEASTVEEMVRHREKSAPTPPSQYVKEIDPLLERVMLRCLERDPAKRPASALQVAAALPGGDPLTAVLAAGETPSPEMVAAAGDEGVLNPRTALVCLAGVVATICLLIFLAPRATIVGLAPMNKSPDALADRARELVAGFGYTELPADSAYWFTTDYKYVRYRALNTPWPQRARQLATTEFGPLRFWYRQSPRAMATPRTLPSVVTDVNPPMNVSGMALVILDPRGRLLKFSAVPPQIENPPGPWPNPNWEALFTSAGLDLNRFTPVDPKWLSPMLFDARAEWAGSTAEEPTTPIQVVAAAYHSQPVYFDVLGPWDHPVITQEAPHSGALNIARATFVILALGVLFGAAFFSRRNFLSGRGDRKGAFRIAAAVFSIEMLEWIVGSHHVANVADEYVMFMVNFGNSLAYAAYVWLAYMALEPYVRRRWPDLLISSTRVISGKVWDPLVGRDVLVGVLTGGAMALAVYVAHALPYWFNLRPMTPIAADERSIGGPGSFVSFLLIYVQYFGITFGLSILAALFLFRVLLRKQWLAIVTVSVVFVMIGLQGENFPLEIASQSVFVALTILVVLRFGLLACMIACFVGFVLRNVPVTLDLSDWYAGRSLFVIALCLGLALYGFRAALAGRPAFGNLAVDD
jgi:hypothetical protein